MHVGGPECGRSADEANRRLGLAEIPPTDGFTPAAVGNANSLVIKAAEGRGPGFWRGPGGKCHPMFDGKACPPGYHIGPERKKCWPN
jgi:hypothetical protein